jgi:hypothetical protein
MADYRDTVGNLPGGPYEENDCLQRDCGTCGAPAGKRCVVETLRGPRPRHMPCLSRLLKREDQ